MKIVIDIPNKDIPTKQDIIQVGLHFMDGKVVECDYPFMELPKGHGRLIDADAFIKEKTEIFCETCDRRRGMKDGKLTKHFVYDIGDAPCRACDTGDMIDYVDDAPTIIEADKE